MCGSFLKKFVPIIRLDGKLNQKYASVPVCEQRRILLPDMVIFQLFIYILPGFQNLRFRDAGQGLFHGL